MKSINLSNCYDLIILVIIKYVLEFITIVRICWERNTMYWSMKFSARIFIIKGTVNLCLLVKIGILINVTALFSRAIYAKMQRANMCKSM